MHTGGKMVLLAQIGKFGVGLGLRRREAPALGSPIGGNLGHKGTEFFVKKR
jgi:hypothetical protein